MAGDTSVGRLAFEVLACTVLPNTLHSKYSAPVAFVFIFNLVVGVGCLTLPHAFQGNTELHGLTMSVS